MGTFCDGIRDVRSELDGTKEFDPGTPSITQARMVR
jgi:hypothetical protein